MSDVFSAAVRFFLTDDVSDGLREIDRNARETSGRLDAISDSAGSRGSKALNALGKAGKIGAAGLGILAGAATGAVATLMATAEESQQTIENNAKLAEAFQSSGLSAEDAQKAYSGFIGLLGDADQATEAAQDMANLAEIGGDIDRWYTIAAGTMSKFGDALPTENLIEAANETARTGVITGGLADALNWSTISAEEYGNALGNNTEANKAFQDALAQGLPVEDAMNAALATTSDATERQAMLQDVLNAVYGEAGASYTESTAGLIAARQAQDNWSTATANAYMALAPMQAGILNLASALLTKLTPYLAKFGEWVTANMPAIQSAVEAFIDGAAQGIDNVIAIASPFFGIVSQFLGWVIQNLPVILPMITGLAAGFAGFSAIGGIISGITNAMRMWKTATEGMKTAQLLLNGALKANPLGLIITVIALVVGALITLWNTNEDFRNAVTNAWNAISGAASAIFGFIGDFISGIFNGIRDTVTGVVNGIKDTITNGFNAAKDTVSNVFNSIKNTISNVLNGAKNIVKNAIDGIKNLFNFNWSLPRLKLPHLTVRGSFNIMPPSVPSFGISWYAKGGIFDAATLLPTSEGFAGVGEAGPEAVAPISVLKGYVTEAVSEAKTAAQTININVTTGETDEAKLARMIAREQRKLAYDL